MFRMGPRFGVQLAVWALFLPAAWAQPQAADQSRLGTIEGVVLGANSQPVAGADISIFGTERVSPAGGATVSTGYSAISDSQGRFSFQNVDPDRYIVTASHPDYSPMDTLGKVLSSVRFPSGSAADAFIVTPGQHLTGVEIHLVPMTILSGRLTDQNGDPLPGATVRPMRADTVLNGRMRLANAGAGVQTDADGRYQLKVYSGNWYLSFLPARRNPEFKVDAAKPGTPAAATAANEPELTYVTTYFPGVRD
ncbi:MAG TPA: carboxypeptidase-like regulatory domain-containing protein, partial [Bryobacteraceae bacterium]|nr:carboxypeptidase-like regulatory domain-containing protein [Bryobacteraceae bacterium]